MALISGANLAPSVAMTVAATLLSPLVTPFWMWLLASQYVLVDPAKMMWGIMQLTVLPVAAGLVFNRLTHRWSTARPGLAGWVPRVMPLVSMAGILLVVGIIAASSKDRVMDVGALLLVAVGIHNLTGYILGYVVARVARLPSKPTVAPSRLKSACKTVVWPPASPWPWANSSRSAWPPPSLVPS